jgi:flagellar hook-associated protein 1 FlgK
MGVEAASVERSRSFQAALLDQLVARRDSETGVSLDEELTNMLKFQHAYTAAARLLQTADEMLQTLLEIKQ